MADPCEHGDLAVELALGLLTGAERADALAHTAGCARCRDAVDELAEVADELLLLAPSAPPPAGFEVAVVAAVASASASAAPAALPDRASTRLHRRRRVLATFLAAAAVVVAIALVAIGSLTAGGPDVRHAVMATPAGRNVGDVWVADRDPSWVVVSVPGWAHWETEVGHPLSYHLSLAMADGSTVEVSGVELDDGGSFGVTTTVDLAAVDSVAIVDDTGRVWCTGELA